MTAGHGEQEPQQALYSSVPQLQVALDVLKGLGLLHTDIKPDKVLLVNLQLVQLRVRLGMELQLRVPVGHSSFSLKA